jgi:hypothetical protein
MSPIVHSKTFLLLLFVLFLCGCGRDRDGPETPDISMGNIHSPVDAKLVHGTLLVARVVVNDSVSLDMLIDTGSSRTYLPTGIFGNSDGQVRISSLCFENDLCFSNFMAWSSDSGFTQSTEGYFNGIIGIDLLRYFDLTLDYKSELIYFFDLLENRSSGLVTLPIHYESGRPFTPVSVEGIPQGENLLDTGAAYTRITSLMLDSLSQNPEVLFKSVIFNFNVSEVVDYVSFSDYCTGAHAIKRRIDRFHLQSGGDHLPAG